MNYHENTAFDKDNLSEAEGEVQKRNTTIETTLNQVELGDYVMYKRRWFGMLAIFVLNLSTGLVWLTFNAVPDISAEWLHTNKSHVNLTVSLIYHFNDFIDWRRISYQKEEKKNCFKFLANKVRRNIYVIAD